MLFFSKGFCKRFRILDVGNNVPPVPLVLTSFLSFIVVTYVTPIFFTLLLFFFLYVHFSLGFSSYRCENTDSKRKFMSITQFVDFINKTQRDPRLNEILYPYANASRAKDLIAEHEPNSYNAQRGLLSIDGLLRYLMSEDNPIVTGSKLELSEDMDQPLAHYFINSSHNTYLSGNATLIL